MSSPDPKVIRRYECLAQETQSAHRVPALSMALHRTDRPLWTYQVGEGATADTQFRLGSVTKTFNAVLVLQCRDDGLLDLDDPIGRHLAVPGHGDLTVRRLLSHTSGLQREPYGDIWDTLHVPDAAELIADLNRVERVLPPGRRYHYSNLGAALLGHLVGRLRGGTWEEVLTEQILLPLGLRRISMYPTGDSAQGYLVDAYSDHARPEPATDLGAVSPAAQLWGTAEDLSKWAGFLADPVELDPHGAILAPSTLDEMRWPITMTAEDAWQSAFGLGLIVVIRPGGDRIVHVGHDGAMPGFLASVYGRRGKGTPGGLGVAVLGSSGTASGMLDLAHTLLDATVADDPPETKPWRPGEPPPPALASVLGRWWSEGFEYVFFWRDGKLRARGADDPAGRPPAVFAPTEDPDILRTESGRETGELLRLARDPESGDVVRMHWATYRVTRDQQTFG